MNIQEKKNYLPPHAEVMELPPVDIITTSNDTPFAPYSGGSKGDW